METATHADNENLWTGAIGWYVCHYVFVVIYTVGDTACLYVKNFGKQFMLDNKIYPQLRLGQ